MYVKTWRMKESVCIQLSAVLQLQISFTFKSVNFCESDVQDNVIRRAIYLLCTFRRQIY